MDSFPASPSGGPAQPAQPVEQIPVQPTQKSNLRKFLNMSSWVTLFAFLPITVLIFLSQDSIPGDLFYPVKKGMESVILAGASLSPVTKAAFATNLTEERFKEAQKMVLVKSNTTGLSAFIDEVQTAQLEISNLKNSKERIQAEEKLVGKIEEYQNSLSNLQAKTEQNLIAYQSQETSGPALISPTPVPSQNQTSQSFPSPTLTIAPSITPENSNAKTIQSSPASIVATITKPSPTIQPSSPQIQINALTSTPIPPTLTVVPTSTPVHITVQETAQIVQQREIAESIVNTKEKLKIIKKNLEEKRNRTKENNERINEKRNEKNEKKEDSENKRENHGKN